MFRVEHASQVSPRSQSLRHHDKQRHDVNSRGHLALEIKVVRIGTMHRQSLKLEMAIEIERRSRFSKMTGFRGVSEPWA